MANAVVAAERWIYGVLAGSAALTAIVGTRIFGHVVPPSAAYPVAYYTTPGAADDLLTADANRVWSALIYAVRVVGKVESYVALEPGATAIETALHKASGSNVSGVIAACIVQSPFTQLSLDKDGFQIRELGSLVRINVQ